MNISKAISSEYGYWSTVAQNIAKDKEKASDLLHDTLARSLESPNFAEIVKRNEHKYYIVAAMFTNFRSPRYDKLYRLRSMEFTESLKNSEDKTWIGARLDNEQMDILISRLPPFERDLFQVYILNECKIEDTARITGIPKSFLRRNIYYSIEKIRNVVSKRNS